MAGRSRLGRIGYNPEVLYTCVLRIVTLNFSVWPPLAMPCTVVEA